ncbi:MAG: 16S rRNA (adenine(1518)-N(6)/adenine(1519)-N(6))-dimethyltransferase RsmA [Bernardetiaceae bacterium]|nr:16S rRNA (adenine(1518)-N(6)/adenine(1519)-N(6))-dimethyltransferase RsmA [Bernardetiaceae bacterium]
MEQVKPKKHLGQHFLKDLQIAARIASLLSGHGGYRKVLEIGAGMGVLTQFLASSAAYQLHIAEIDPDSIAYLQKMSYVPAERLHHVDFLDMHLDEIAKGEPLALIGNLPYNISSQIFFKLLENRHFISEMVCMIQKEVAMRIAAKPGGKEYGILSVLLQAFYDIQYAFTVHEHVFQPPPKVKSAVITLRRNAVEKLSCNEAQFFTVVKTAFNQRRKTLRNALKPLGIPVAIAGHPLLAKRAEQLGVAEFVALTQMLQ